MSATGETPTLVVQRDEHGVAHLLIHRPDAANSIDVRLAHELREAVNAVMRDSSTRAVVLAATGPPFCAGGDLRAIAADGSPADYVRKIAVALHETVVRLHRLDVPVVAAVEGAVAGAGLGLMMSADITVAGASTAFRMAYTAIGLSPDGGTSWLLPRRVGLQRALELTLTNRRLSADEALAIGLVNEVVPDGAATQRAVAIALGLAAGSTPAFASARRLLRTAFDTPLEVQLETELEHLCAHAASPEAAERIRAVLARTDARKQA
jgi:2-(1,2-epoxy-1,2-dihydrophenyl)acetyl-CoA isomerase